MKVKEFNKLIKKEKPQELIKKYMLSEIYLTNKQLQKVIDKRGTEEQHGGFCFGKRK